MVRSRSLREEASRHLESGGWRLVAEFPNYMISPDGEVRNAQTGRMIRPVVTPERTYVRLFKNGKLYTRSPNLLLTHAYPLIDVEEALGDWHVIPGFDQYEINHHGRVRRVSTKRDLKVFTDSGDYVNLSVSGETHRMSISSLLRIAGHQ